MAKTNLFLLLPDSGEHTNPWIKGNDQFLDPKRLKDFINALEALLKRISVENYKRLF
jgi:hypothetical protein